MQAWEKYLFDYDTFLIFCFGELQLYKIYSSICGLGILEAELVGIGIFFGSQRHSVVITKK